MNQTTEQETREDARPDVACSATLGRDPTRAEIDSACMSYRHDYGLLPEAQRAELRFHAIEWHRAWRKATARAGRCGAQHGSIRCEREAGHDGVHVGAVPTQWY